jgi:4-amino-4-deoxy-L-arabinose transferase-like glycosyltransferase
MATHSAELDSTPSPRNHSKVLLIILFAILATAIWYIFFSHHFFQPYDDGLDYAQIAENIYSGRGMITKVYPLFGLNFLEEKNLLDKDWPNLHRFPFPIFGTALMYRAFGVNNFSTAFTSGIFYILSIPLFFLLSHRLLKSTMGAILVTIILMFNSLILRYSINNTTEMPSIFLFLSSLYILLFSKYVHRYALLGVILGISYYNRYNIIIFIPILVVFIVLFEKENRKRDVVKLLASFFVVVVPWFAYSLSYGNNPLFSLTSKADFPALTRRYPHLHSLWFGIDYVNEWEFALGYPSQVSRKWIEQFLLTRKHFPWLVGDSAYLFAFFFVGLFVREQDPPKVRLKVLVYLLFTAQVLLVPFYVNRARFFLLFTPVFMLLGFDYFLRVVADLRLRKWMRYSVIGIMVLVFCSSGIKVLITGRQNQAVDYGFGSEMEKNLSSLNALVTPEDVIMSDIVVATGRYVSSRSLPLPENYETLTRTQEEFVPVKYILLSSYLFTEEIWREWWPVFEQGEDIGSFALIKEFSDGTLLYMNEDLNAEPGTRETE